MDNREIEKHIGTGEMSVTGESSSGQSSRMGEINVSIEGIATEGRSSDA